jgi:hypothetical protein
MMLHCRLPLFCVLALGIVLPMTLVTAQEPAQEESAQPQDRRGPLPFYFGKLGLSDAQREEMYTLRAAYDEKIKPLEEQIALLKEELNEKLETKLTPGQKLRLKELREEARQRGKEAPDETSENDDS